MGKQKPTTNERINALWKLTGNIQSGVSFHPVPPRQGIFDGRRQGVSEMQRSSHIRWWNHHDELFIYGAIDRIFRIAAVVTTLFPPVLPSGFDC